ncbi:hypothetical protein ACFU9X_43280 [Streptomyces atratus]
MRWQLKGPAPAKAPHRSLRTTSQPRCEGELLPFGQVISKMVAERGWELAAAGGTILEQ